MIEIKSTEERAESYLSTVLDELKDKPIELTGFRRNPSEKAEDDLLVFAQNNASVVIKLDKFEGLLIKILKLEYIPELFWGYNKNFFMRLPLEADNPELLDTIYEDIAVRIIRKLTRGKKINTDKIIEKVLTKYNRELLKLKAN